MLIENEDGQLMLFVQDLEYGRTCQVVSPLEIPKEAISERSLRRSSKLRNRTLMCLDLRPGAGNLLGPYWEYDPPWLGQYGPLNTSACPRDATESCLSSILQDSVPSKFYLTPTACLGILRRAKERGKPLPPQLDTALRIQAGLLPPDAMETRYTVAFAANQRDEVRDLHDVAGALGAQPGMKQQTFVAEGVVTKGNGDCYLTHEKHTSLSTGGGQAGQGYPCVMINCLTPWDSQQTRIFTPEGKAPTVAGADGGGGRNPAGLLFTAGFCAGAGAKAGSIGYAEECAPTLKAGPSGNMMPSVLCLMDQGGQRMDLTENVTGTLRAQDHGHEPLVLASQQGHADIGVNVCPTITAAAGMSGNNQPVLFEGHGHDLRYKQMEIAPTISSAAGMGGGNIPLIGQKSNAVYCITGNAIDRQPQNGGNGIGYQEDLAYTLTRTDRHAVYVRQRVDVFREDDIASTESARQHKDATDLVYQETVGALTSSDRKGPNSQYVSQDKCIVEGPHLIRRLTPLECERLQAFPDGWTDIPGASDSARYKALGNSVAVVCVEAIMEGIVLAMEHPENIWAL